ncbi:MAG: nucleotidyl transferase AbiEii/AbiGii toxin family protein [Candidatus Peribacteraceae bacterium]
MQNLVRLVEQLKRKHAPEQMLINHIREYLQVLILKSIAHSQFSSALSFMGGTALRICYDLKRFSEDLDFALDRPARGYSFQKVLNAVQRDLEAAGYEIEISGAAEKTVEKAFVKLSKVLYPLGLSARENQKIHIKIEVDTKPVNVDDDQLESFFVTKFDEIFPILKHRLETLFAGKITAILSRSYAKGRDYYDLIWYLSRKTRIDMKYLNAGIKGGELKPFKTEADVIRHVANIVAEVHPEKILKDIGRFLEDPTEERWLRDYQRVFDKLASPLL